MPNNEISTIVNAMFNAIEQLIPEYMKNPIDKEIANGNVAACIIDENGVVHGKMFGTNKPRL